MKFKFPFSGNGSEDLKGFLDHGTSLTGELSFTGTLRIDGNVHGSISTPDLLIIGERASIHADIKAAEVQVYGSISGNIESSRKIEIFSTGRLHGDVRTKQLVIWEGGQFEGHSGRAVGSESSSGESAADFSQATEDGANTAKES